MTEAEKTGHTWDSDGEKCKKCGDSCYNAPSPVCPRQTPPAEKFSVEKIGGMTVIGRKDDKEEVGRTGPYPFWENNGFPALPVAKRAALDMIEKCVYDGDVEEFNVETGEPEIVRRSGLHIGMDGVEILRAALVEDDHELIDGLMKEVTNLRVAIVEFLGLKFDTVLPDDKILIEALAAHRAKQGE